MRLTSVFSLLVLIVVFGGCRKKNTEVDYKPNLNVAYNSTLAEDIFQDVFLTLFQAGYDSALHQSGQEKIYCADVFYESWPDSVVIRVEYPNYNITCPDYLSRRGEYLLQLGGAFGTPNTIGKLTFISFAVEDIRVSGTMEFTNLGDDAEQHPNFSFASSNINLSLPDSIQNIKWQADKTIVWILGNNLPQNFEDDVFEISGSSKGKSSRGHSFTINTTGGLIKNSYCRWIPGGSYKINMPDLEVQITNVYFNNLDSCNAKFEMYIEGGRFFEDFIRLYLPAGMY
jgi:hypothetical protein